MKKTHKLKILPCYYYAVDSGDKRFEIRDNSDRGFQKGDIVLLMEFESGKFTGNELEGIITYVTNFEQKDDYVVFGFELYRKTYAGKKQNRASINPLSK